MNTRRRVLAALALTLLLGALLACETEQVELLGDTAAHPTPSDGSGDATTTPPPDILPDQQVADQRAADQQAPDTAPGCLCRFNMCRTNTECQQSIGATSTCSGTLCSGAVGSCSVAADCGDPQLWICTVSPTSTTPCS